MRVFFIVDQGSTIRPSTLRQLLNLPYLRAQYEVLPLRSDHYSGLRTDINGLRRYAIFETERVFAHYSDVARCIAVVGAQLPSVSDSSKTVPMDYVLCNRGGAVWTFQILNPPSGPDRYIASAPTLQPELVERVIELAEMTPSSA
jgi:hypothetical protein